MTNRYDTNGNPQGQYQPGSNDEVLSNKLGIIDSDEMDDVELVLLQELQSKLLEDIEMDQRLTISDLCEWHKIWLGQVYPWAGEYRSVNIQKGEFMFAAANRIPGLMLDFESNFLVKHTPCEGFDKSGLIESLAICHVELIIIHPFREGNGRIARVLATIMALQAGMPLLDFTWISEHEAEYITAIHQGHAGDYGPMKRVFSEVLQASMI